MDNIARQPVRDELIANTGAFTFWSSAVKDAFEEATDLTLEFERDPTDQGTRTDGRYMVGKHTKLQAPRGTQRACIMQTTELKLETINSHQGTSTPEIPPATSLSGL
ncbi:hypothetical protein BT69DRAFT_1295976 [Atractiella rhizophila]|nr:hypothetical protein BT69DRAFT_1295976 [Atractiella rhizophila]